MQASGCELLILMEALVWEARRACQQVGASRLAGAGVLRLLCLRQFGPAQPCRSLLLQCRKGALCASSVMSLPMPLYHRGFP